MFDRNRYEKEIICHSGKSYIGAKVITLHQSVSDTPFQVCKENETGKSNRSGHYIGIRQV